MPYKLSNQGGKVCVVKEDTGETMKCYPSRMQALAYLRALYANVEDAKPKPKLPPLGKKKK